MNYYETGKTDGISQCGMDRLAESNREGEWLAFTAMTSLATKFDWASEHKPDRISQTQYACGFVEGYLLSSFGYRACPNCGHAFNCHSAWIGSPGDMTCIENPGIEEFPVNLLAVSERLNQEDQIAAEFYDLMAENQ